MFRRLACLVLLLPPLVAQATPTLRVLAIEGTPYERGLTHGRELRAAIHTLQARWEKDVRTTFRIDLDTLVARFLAGTSYDEAARRHTPELLDEVRGIAAGCGLPYERMLAWQLIDELWAQGSAILTDKCTTIGVDRRADRPTMVAQNLDVPRWYHDFATVLHMHDAARELQTLVVTIPGLVAANGMNSARVAVGVNTILQIAPCRDGLPVAFVVRGVLAQTSHADALAFLRRVRHASGQCYTVGGPDTAPAFECSAGKVVPFASFAGKGHTFHTNHPLASDDFSPAIAQRVEQSGRPPAFACSRYDRLLRTLPADAEVDFAQVLAALSDRTGAGATICNGHTYVCTIFVLGEQPELHIAPGPPDITPFQVLRFEAAAVVR